MLPAELLQARELRRTGLLLSSGLVISGAAFLTLKDGALATASLRIAAAAALSAAALLAAAKLVLQDRLAVELYSTGVAVEIVPSLKGPLLKEGAVQVSQALPIPSQKLQ